ncbi:MAG: NTP transferase domain-containing protein [Muribaculaceae bacterium]|nr:NTP transferase domain-containing protein [Muribaculaceae bacterium]
MNFGIIAAGEGSRLVEEGVAYPKPLVPLAGRPMIGRLIDIFMENGAERIAVIVNEEMKEVREYLFSLQDRLPVELTIIVKSTPSSMHSFFEVASVLGKHGRFIATTVDTIFHEEDFRRYVEAYASAGKEIEGMMALTRYIDDEKPLYVEVNEAGDITAFLDAAPDNPEFVSGGIYGLNDSAVKVLDKCMAEGVSRMRNFQRALIASGLKIKGYDMGKIIDVDHAGDIKKAEEFLKE